MKILIDNGHGCDTPGKCSPRLEDGSIYREYQHSRLLAKAIEKELVRQGYDAELLVPELSDVSLSRRARRANDYATRLGKSNVIVVSIHSNAAGNGGWCQGRGWSIYTSPGVTKSDTLATCIYEAVEKELRQRGYYDTFTAEDTARKQKPMRSDFSDGDPDYEAKFYILTKTACPAVLSENLFHDNRADLDYLTSQPGINAIVQGHVNGIIAYINKVQS